MTSTNLLLLILIGLMAGNYWPTRRQRSGRGPQPRYTSLESAVDHMTEVADGLAEDVDSLRQEIRAMASLPPETQVPRLMRELRTNRLLTYVLIALHVLLGLALALLYLELRRRGVLAIR